MSYCSDGSNACPSPKTRIPGNDAYGSSHIPNAVVPSTGPGNGIVRPVKSFIRTKCRSRFRSNATIVAVLLITLAISVDLFANTSTSSYHCAGAVLHPPCSGGCPQLVLLVKVCVEMYLVGLTFIPVLLAIEDWSQRSGNVSRDEPAAPTKFNDALHDQARQSRSGSDYLEECSSILTSRG